MEELKPCPFYSHKVQKLKMHHRKSRWYKDGLFAVKCEICNIRGAYQLTEQRAIDAWNRRSERTCKGIDVNDELHGTDCPAWMCSECGELFEAGAKYCSQCGAKVVN